MNTPDQETHPCIYTHTHTLTAILVKQTQINITMHIKFHINMHKLLSLVLLFVLFGT